MSRPPEPGGLDPDAAIKARVGAPVPATQTDATEGVDPPRRSPPPAIIDTRRYQWMIGLFGLALVVAFSIYLFAKGGNGTPGIAAGQRLHRFVAPLATSNLDASANANPVCDPARPSLRGLNICDRRPVVLAFFALGAKPCIRQVDTFQQIAHEFPRYQFAAVAVNGGLQATDKLVRQHRWTIPVAYDSGGTIGEVYGVEICPLVEIANAHGIVQRRLLGKAWLAPNKLAGVMRKLGS